MKTYIVILLATLFCASCEKEISIDLNSSNPQLVIEGNISDAPGPYSVKLSKTVNFSSTNIYPPVRGAFITISDNTGIIDTLTEVEPGLYKTHTIVGTEGNTYILKVMTEGKQYDAISTMPKKIPLDSIQFDPFSDPGSSDKKVFSIVPLYYDPIEMGDCYRFFFSVNGVADKTYQVSNDNVGNGTLNQQPFWSDNLEYLSGDTVNVTMFCIDVNTYNYYYTLSQISESGPGGGATPSNPPNNITGNKALGVFSAYTTQTKTAIIR